MKTVKIQGVLVSVDGVGVLLRGPAGSGKSLAALNLMRRGHYLVADDLVEVFPGPNGETMGRGVEKKVRIEVRGLGIFHAESLFPSGTLPSAAIDFVAELDRYDPAKDLGRIVPETGKLRVLDSDLLTVRVPVASGIDPALLIELLVRVFKKDGTVNLA
jgi:HPr kinase/phosphorylase